MGRTRQLAGSRILITGASQGIGRALALAAARQGMRLVLVARSADLLETVEREARATGADCLSVAVDISLPDDRQRILDTAVARFGGLDILVNNAGIGATGHFMDAGEDRLRRIMEVNFFALTETIRLAVPILARGVRPLIVNIGSIAGKRGIPSRSEYSASKFAVQGFTEAIRAEMVRYGIDVLLVSPGLTNTNFPKNMLENKARAALDHLRSMSPEQVAGITLRAMARGKREVTLSFRGQLLVLVNRLAPWLIERIAARRVRKLYAEEIVTLERARARQSEPVHS